MEKLVLETVNPELGKIVLDVAEECDTRFCDRMTLKIPAFNFKTRIVVDGQEIEVDISNDEELAREEKNHRELKQLIKRMINNDATTGYIKAYEMCGDIDNDLTREIRYRTYKDVPYLLYQHKIDICKKYAEIKKQDEEKIAEDVTILQYEMVKNGEYFNPIEVFQSFRKAYEHYEKEAFRKNRLMWLYNSRKMQDGIIYWEKIFLPVFENVYKDNIGFWGEIVFDILITRNDYDMAERFLDKWEQNELGTTPSENSIFNSYLNFIESNRQRLVFLRKGFHFSDSYTKVVCYDDLTIIGNKEEVALIKIKYKKVILKFRELLTLRVVYEYGTETYINVCEELISIIPQVLSYTNEINKYVLYNDPCGQTMGYDVFKQLSIYYQKQNKVVDAIRVCKKGIECGYIDDGTKSGMYGRLQRLLKNKQ